MKYVSLVVAALLVGGAAAYWWFELRATPAAIGHPAALSTPAGSVPAMPEAPPAADAARNAIDAQANPELAAKEALAAEKQEQIRALMIRALMAEFDEVRFDADRRDEIEARIEVLMAEYNALVLPVALHKMDQDG